MNKSIILGRFINRLLTPLKLRLVGIAAGDDIYNHDGLMSVHNHEFIQDPDFLKAYARGVTASNDDYHIHWRLHIALWAASCARRLNGDFVECGVNKGFVSSAIMEYLDWNSTNKTFYLLDTFEGVRTELVSEEEKSMGALRRNEDALKKGYYVSNVDSVKANFSEWDNARIIKGIIPESLSYIDSENIAYLHLDLNCSAPEVAAIDFLWDRLVDGAFILLDDYAYYGYRPQKIGMDVFAKDHEANIVSLPTGQGLLIRNKKNFS